MKQTIDLKIAAIWRLFQNLGLEMALCAGILVHLIIAAGCSQGLNELHRELEDAENAGWVTIHFNDDEGNRTFSPKPRIFTHYVLEFTGEGRGVLPKEELAAGENRQFTLEAGVWTIRAVGFMDSENGDPSFAAAEGSVQVTVKSGEQADAVIVLDNIVGMSSEEGFLNYAVDFPGDLAGEASLSLSRCEDDGRFSPYMSIDLLEEGAAENTISLQSGYYRMDLKVRAVYSWARRNEVVHIYPRLETAVSYLIEEDDFPRILEFSNVTDMKEYLDNLPLNTQENPYPVKLRNVDLSSGENTGNTLRTLYAALSRFVTLDLKDSAGDHFPSVSFTGSTAKKENIISIVLPDSITAIDASGFFQFNNLVSAELPKVTRLYKGAFKECKKLESVYMPELLSIEDGSSGSGAFNACSALTSVYLPKAQAIGAYAFYRCTSLAALSLPSAEDIGGFSFKSCENLDSVYLPLAESIGSSAFNDCGALQTLILGNVPPVPVVKIESIFEIKKFIGGIYVPADAVETYKASSAWSALKDKILSLDELPAEE